MPLKNVEVRFPTGTEPRTTILFSLDALPRKGESLLFIHNGEEAEFTVHHVIHIFDRDEGKYDIQLVVR